MCARTTEAFVLVSTVALRAKLSFIVILVMAAVMLPFGWFTARELERSAVDGATKDLISTNTAVINMIAGHLDGSRVALLRLGAVFREHYQGEFSLDERESVTVAGISMPFLKLNGQPVSLDNQVVKDFTRGTGGTVATIFVKKGDDFVRVSTSLLKENGTPALGTFLGKDHPAYRKVIAGLPYQGPARLFGRYYMTEYLPIKNAAGRVIALLFVGMDLTDSFNSLLQKARGLTIKQSGYVFIVDANPGEGYGHFILHPAKEGKNALVDAQATPIQEMLDRRDGLVFYPWRNPELGEKVQRNKMAAFNEYRDLGWVVSTSVYVDDFLQPYYEGRYRMILVLIFASVFGTLALNLAIGRWVIRPMLRLQERRRAAELTLRTLIDAIPDMVQYKDGEGHWLEVNAPVLQAFHLEGKDYQGKTNSELLELGGFPPEAFASCQKSDELAWQAGKLLRVEEALSPDGSGQRTFDIIKVPLFNEDGSRKGLVVVGRDITQLRQTEAQQRLAARVFETTGEAIMVTDANASIVLVNPAFCRITGYSETEVLGRNPRILNSGRHDWGFHARMWQSLKAKGAWSGEIWNQRKNGEIFPEWQTVSSVRDENGTITHYVSVFADLSEIREAQETAELLSWHDSLTGLPNREHFIKELNSALARAHREERFADVLLLDLDRFKDINEARGLVFGDKLLKTVSDRLREVLHDDDVIARFVADEFAILLWRPAVARDVAGRWALGVAERLRTLLQDTIEVEGEVIHLDASIGVALFPESSQTMATDLLSQADMAVHQAKADGGGRTVFFEKAMGEAVQERFELERELRQAIHEGQLRLYLQSQFDGAGQVVGAEALVRWKHPVRGLVPPGAFIPLAETSDLIVAIDHWVLTEVCQLLVKLDAEGEARRISVNISPRHFNKPDFVEEVTRCLSASGADPTHLVLEVTEGTVIHDIDSIVTKMNQLSALGIHFSMDDFGTGYSSLSYLKRLPIHELKIDKSFIEDVPDDPNDTALVETILAVAHHLHLQVVAEGVERATQARFLKAHGGVIYQGYLYGRPLPVEEWVPLSTGDAVC